MHILKIKINDDCPNKDVVINYYQNKIKTLGYEGDSGIDLIFPSSHTFKQGDVIKCNLGISCEFYPSNSETSKSFLLMARSSIANTPLMLANSVGLIDAKYRGPIIAALRAHNDWTVDVGHRLVQIVAPDLEPIQIEIVNELSTTTRGEKGFGSTGTN